VFDPHKCADAPPQPPRLLTHPSATLICTANPIVTAAFQSLVCVSFHTPVVVDGQNGWQYVGVGVIIDARLGLVVVDR
jgi:hypothetical protein